jgi:hypothetical protein
MGITKKENRVEQLRGEQRLDKLAVFIGSALGGFRGRFSFGPSFIEDNTCLRGDE